MESAPSKKPLELFCAVAIPAGDAIQIDPFAMIKLTTLEDLNPSVSAVLDRLTRQLNILLPDAEIQHVGSTAIPGSITKGDVDVLARVSEGGFADSILKLKAAFMVKQPQNWTPAFASFGDDTGYPLPVGVQLVIRHSEYDAQLTFLRDFLISRPEELREYNDLKQAHAGKGADEYWRAKDAFFTRILNDHAEELAKSRAARSAD